MSAISPPERPRRNVALIISLCVNLVLVGIIATAVVRMHYFHPMMSGGRMGGPGMAGMAERQQVRQMMSPRVLMAVAPDKQDALRAVGRAHRDQLDSLRAAAVAARREVLRLYTAPTLDRPALDQALTRMQQADAALESEAVKATAEAGAVLSADERKRVLGWQPRGGRGHGGGWHGRRGGDGPPPRDE
jgi:uncharacterized membrane protein